MTLTVLASKHRPLAAVLAHSLAALLTAAGATFSQVARTTVFLADLNDFSAMNAVYAKHFGDPPPARSTVQVSRLPRDVRVEIDVIAVIG